MKTQPYPIHMYANAYAQETNSLKNSFQMESDNLGYNNVILVT